MGNYKKTERKKKEKWGEILRRKTERDKERKRRMEKCWTIKKERNKERKAWENKERMK